MQAKDIMTNHPISLALSTEVPKAIEIMLENDISIAAVLSYDKTVVGQISEVMLMKAFILSKETPDIKILDNYKHIFKPADTVTEDDPIDKVVKILLKSHYNRVLVVTKSGMLKGIISPKDIIRGLMGEEKRSGSMLSELMRMQIDIEKLQKRLDHSQEKASTYEKFIEGSEYMMHSSDKNGKIVMANNKLHAALGFKTGELIGRNVVDLYEMRHHQEVKESLERLVKEGKFHKVYTTFVTKAGVTLRVEVASSVLKSVKGEFLATSTISRVIDQDDLLRALHGVYKTESSLPGDENKK